MAGEGATKLITFTGVKPGATASAWWNNANAEVYRLNAWPKVAPGRRHASAEITQVRSVVHGTPSEKEVISPSRTPGRPRSTSTSGRSSGVGHSARCSRPSEASGASPGGGAPRRKEGITAVDVAGIRKHGNNTAVEVGDRWHLGSDTKAITATLLAVLADKGLVGWDLTVGQAFPDWAQSMKAMFKNMQFEELMAHRSGIFDVTRPNPPPSVTPPRPLPSAGASSPNSSRTGTMATASCSMRRASPSATRTRISSWPRR